jgi:hypothetical protein
MKVIALNILVGALIIGFVAWLIDWEAGLLVAVIIVWVFVRQWRNRMKTRTPNE